MKTRKTSLLYVLSCAFILTSCGGDTDPTGKLWWIIFAFPLSGLAYIVGGMTIPIFQSKEDRAKSDSPEPVPAIIVGTIVLVVLYGLIKALF